MKTVCLALVIASHDSAKNFWVVRGRRRCVPAGRYATRVSCYRFIFFIAVISNPLNAQDTVLQMLQDAIASNSRATFSSFLAHWEKEVQPVTDDLLRSHPRVSQEAYRLYDLFYDLKNLNTLGDIRIENVYDLDNDYAIIQNDLRITVVSELIDDSTLKILQDYDLTSRGYHDSLVLFKLTLNDFRPRLTHQKRVLYLTEKYHTTVQQSLYWKNKGHETGIKLFKERILGFHAVECYNKCEIETEPRVLEIVFNSTLTRARVSFVLTDAKHAEAGFTMYISKDDYWLKSSSRIYHYAY